MKADVNAFYNSICDLQDALLLSYQFLQFSASKNEQIINCHIIRPFSQMMPFNNTTMCSGSAVRTAKYPVICVSIQFWSTLKLYEQNPNKQKQMAARTATCLSKCFVCVLTEEKTSKTRCSLSV